MQLRLDPDHRRAERGGRQVDLTAREFALLSVLVERAGDACPTDELVALVWGPAIVARDDVVHEYVARLRSKLGDDVIDAVPGDGYRIRRAA
jgi:DNA-binding response OmpR family regulator